MATTLETKIAEAESALHKLVLGQSAVEVWDGEFRVTYTPANQDKLERYLADLRAQAAPAVGALPARRPLTFVF